MCGGESWKPPPEFGNAAVEEEAPPPAQQRREMEPMDAALFLASREREMEPMDAALFLASLQGLEKTPEKADELPALSGGGAGRWTGEAVHEADVEVDEDIPAHYGAL